MVRTKRMPLDPAGVTDQIADTAERLFREVGYAKTTVADIAAALGMSPANVYRYFSSKADITEAICERLLLRVEAQCQKAVAEQETATDKLRHCILEYHRAMKLNTIKEKRLYDMVIAAVDQHWSVITEHIRRMHGVFVQLLQQGMHAGEFRPGDAGKTAKSLQDAFAVFVYPALIEKWVADAQAIGIETDLEAGIRNLLDLLLCGLRA